MTKPPARGEQDRRGARLDQQPLEDRALAEEAPVLLGRAEAEDLLDARSVVPGPVEQDDLTRRREMLKAEPRNLLLLLDLHLAGLIGFIGNQAA